VQRGGVDLPFDHGARGRPEHLMPLSGEMGWALLVEGEPRARRRSARGVLDPEIRSCGVGLSSDAEIGSRAAGTLQRGGYPLRGRAPSSVGLGRPLGRRMSWALRAFIRCLPVGCF
jgi:hypothetical protein